MQQTWVIITEGHVLCQPKDDLYLVQWAINHGIITGGESGLPRLDVRDIRPNHLIRRGDKTAGTKGLLSVFSVIRRFMLLLLGGFMVDFVGLVRWFAIVSCHKGDFVIRVISFC